MKPGRTCPWCKKGKTIVRKRKRDGLKFTGCDKFPRCRYTPEADFKDTPSFWRGSLHIDYNDELRPY